MPSQEERIYAALIHGLSIFFPFLTPLIAFLILKDRGGFAFNQAKEGLNFQITVILASIFLTITIVGILALPVVLVAAEVILVFATIQVALGRNYRFPLTLRLIK